MRKYGFIVFGLLGAAALGALEYRRDVQHSFPQQAERTRLEERTRIYTEWAPYDIYSNFMNYWIDRPLLQDTSLRDAADPFAAGYTRELEYLPKYQIDGFASLDYPELYRRHLAVENACQPGPDTSAPTHLLVLPGYEYPDGYDKIKAYVTTALAAPQTCRIGGKAVFFLYYPPSAEAVGALRERLRAEPEIGDRFRLLNNMPFEAFHSEFAGYDSEGIPPPPELLERYREAVRQALGQSDGLILQPRDIGTTGFESLWEAKVLPSYRNFMLPIILEELKRPEYAEKLLAAYVFRSYTNHLSGNNVAEYGTRQLRLYLDEVLRATPDLLVLFEWNEANENTNFQPTVANGWSNARLLRYYVQRMNGLPYTALEGDDLTIPNLVFSCRQQVRLGELIHYELLNIPDGDDATGVIRARLTLRDQDGKLLQEFPEEQFDPNELTAVSYRVATDTLGSVLAVVPELRVTGTDGRAREFRQLDRTVVRPTANWRYKDSFHALRDLWEPEAVTFEATLNPDGSIHIAATLTAPEELHALEVLEDHEEVTAADPTERFDSSRYTLFRGTLTGMDTVDRLLKVTGNFRVFGVSDWKLYSDRLAHNAMQVLEKSGDSARVYLYPHWMPSTFALAIPKDEVGRAVLELDYPDGFGRHTFELGDVAATGKIARTLNRNVRLDLGVSDRLIDNPAPLNRKSAAITCDLRPRNPFPSYQLRAITKDGKIYRSQPVTPLRPGMETVPLRVYSEFDGEVKAAQVPAARIPDIRYEWNPARGAMLANTFSPEYDAQLGGGFSYLEPMWKTPLPYIAADYQSFAPTWQDGVLEFDGISNYINFPRETLPRGAYEVEFELNTPGNREQVLLRSYAYDGGGTLQLLLTEDNELYATSAQNEWNAPFKTGLKVPCDQWTRIGVRYDLKEITFSVDTQSVVFPFAGRGNRFKPAAFGGTTQPHGPVTETTGYFKGKLRSFRVRHTSEPEK